MHKEVVGAELGFAEKAEAWSLQSRFFPSKIGGFPAWLDLLNLPKVEELNCSVCKQPCVFLAQVYAPDDDLEEGTAKETCFHRSIFLFVCRNGECCRKNSNDNFVVLRCQLPQKNSFYPLENPKEKPTWRPDIDVKTYVKICAVCGCLGSKQCGGCKKVNYCCREHQVMHWKSHKNACKEGNVVDKGKSENSFILPEFEIDIENEKVEIEADETMSELKSMKQYESLVAEGKAGTFQDDSSVDEELNNLTVKGDKVFLKFKERTSLFPEQVLRYDKNNPLWVSASHQPLESYIPPCQLCGGKRQFEFQIMPQALNYLSLDNIGASVDWGTLAVYICASNCDLGGAYKKEFLWKQDFDDDTAKSAE